MYFRLALLSGNICERKNNFTESERVSFRAKFRFEAMQIVVLGFPKNYKERKNWRALSCKLFRRAQPAVPGGFSR